MNREYVFATHMGIGNRGCEALTKSLCLMLNLQKEQTIIYSKYYDEDIRSDLKKYGKIVRVNRWDQLSLLKKMLYKLKAILVGNSQHIDLLKYDLTDITSDSVVFMTGGDLYCYEGTVKLMKFIHEYAVKQGAFTLLIGCSIEEKFLTEDVIEDLQQYDLITVRESITLDNLKKKGIQENVYLIPDSAFALLPQSKGVNIQTEKDIVGINISIYVNGGEQEDTLFFRNIENVITYILENTELSVMLVPHVFWEEQDDRKLAAQIKRKFCTSRVWVLDSENLNYCQIRYAISKCRFFMGARTHSVISAYSVGVPTIALGYSVKAAGIAKDLWMSRETVIDCKKLRHEDELLQAYFYLEKNEKEIRGSLKQRIPSYIKKVDYLRELVDKIYEKSQK